MYKRKVAKSMEIWTIAREKIQLNDSCQAFLRVTKGIQLNLPTLFPYPTNPPNGDGMPPPLQVTSLIVRQI